MISFREYINESNRKTSRSRRMYETIETVHPKNKDELVRILQNYFDREEPDWKCDLNWIDTSKITDMSNLFSHTSESSGKYGLGRFNGDISKWNVSKVKDMEYMFYESKFNRDISKWNVSKVEDMGYMFTKSKFNGDISKWDVSDVEEMDKMFLGSSLEGNKPDWYK